LVGFCISKAESPVKKETALENQERTPVSRQLHGSFAADLNEAAEEVVARNMHPAGARICC
jgi:hypothetical protein